MEKVKNITILLLFIIILPARRSLGEGRVERSLRALEDILQLVQDERKKRNIKKNRTVINPTFYNNSMHWHSIKCLSLSTYFLSRFCEQHYCYKPCNIIEQPDYIQIDSTQFFHPKIQKCLKNLIQTKSLKPLLLLLKQTQNTSIIQDNLFFHELYALIFTVHKQILFNECAECSYTLKATTFETIIEISDKINQLPIAEVLNAIDMLITELPPFLEKYEFNSKLTWKTWFKKYWWVLPVFGAWFGLKILLNLQRNHFYYTTYLPRPQIPLQPVVITEVTNPVLVELELKKEPLQI